MRDLRQAYMWVAGLAACLALGGIVWACFRWQDPAPLERDHAAGGVLEHGSDPASSASPTGPAPAAPSPAEQRSAVDRSLAAANTALASPSPGQTLRVRLRGLHPNAPWTTKLNLFCEGSDAPARPWLNHVDAQAPDALGLATFSLPTWTETATRQKGNIGALDPNYQPTGVRWITELDLTQELVLDVQVVASLEGRVVTTRGEPVTAARISAFALENGVAGDGPVGQTNTRQDGGYQLRVPPDLQILLVASPMQPVSLSGNVFTTTDGSTHDNGHARDDLLPATTSARGSVGTTTKVVDLILPDAALVRGIVRWTDERPIANARVWIRPLEGHALSLSDHAAIRRTANGSFAPVTAATTDAEGHFRLPGLPGIPCRLELEKIEGIEVVGDYLTVAATAPQDIELRVPLPLVLRAVHNGSPAPGAAIEIEADWPQSATGRLRWPDLRTDGNGEVRVVSTLLRLRVRATSESLQSAWLDIEVTPARRVALELAALAQSELAIEFTDEFPVRNGWFSWVRSDGAEGRQGLVRDDSSGPFRLPLEPGRYHLHIVAAGSEREGLFALPIERDVVMTAAPQSLTLPVQIGGRFTVFATDSRGLYPSGTCRVLDASGGDRTAQFLCRDDERGARVGEPGELLAGGPNEFSANLPPGVYLLDFGFAEHGGQQQRVTIKAREVTNVRLRLP